MNILYVIFGTIIISLFIGSITYFIIEASNIKKNNNNVVDSFTPNMIAQMGR